MSNLNINRNLGYIRVSAKDQNVDRQMEAMIKEGIQNRDIFIDKQSGKDFDREQYKAMKYSLRPGDTLFVKELDRLGRNAQEIKDEWEDITQNIGADIVVMDMPALDTRQFKSGLEKLISSIILELLSYMAQNEREKILDRQREGITAAKNAGKYLGRPKLPLPEDFEQLYQEWKNGSITAAAAMRQMKMSATTFYRRVAEYEETLKEQR